MGANSNRYKRRSRDAIFSVKGAELIDQTCNKFSVETSSEDVSFLICNFLSYIIFHRKIYTCASSISLRKPERIKGLIIVE